MLLVPNLGLAQLTPPGTTGETAIRVLFVTHPSTTASQFATATSSIISSWNSTGLNSVSSTGLIIEIANSGNSIQYTPASTDSLTVISDIEAFVSSSVGGQRSLRVQHGADIVIGLYPTLTKVIAGTTVPV